MEYLDSVTYTRRRLKADAHTENCRSCMNLTTHHLMSEYGADGDNFLTRRFHTYFQAQDSSSGCTAESVADLKQSGACFA